MRRLHVACAVALTFAFALGLSVQASADPDPWPNSYTAVNVNTVPFSVDAVDVANLHALTGTTDTGATWAAHVYLSDADYAAGWRIGGLGVYITNYGTIPTALQQSKTAYVDAWSDKGNSVGWGLDGGWSNSIQGAPVTPTGRFVWEGGSGNWQKGAYCWATNLPTFTSANTRYAVALRNPTTGATYFEWQQEGGGGPQKIPEPGSLLLMTLGLGTVGALGRRRILRR